MATEQNFEVMPENIHYSSYPLHINGSI